MGQLASVMLCSGGNLFVKPDHYLNIGSIAHFSSIYASQLVHLYVEVLLYLICM